MRSRGWIGVDVLLATRLFALGVRVGSFAEFPGLCRSSPTAVWCAQGKCGVEPR